MIDKRLQDAMNEQIKHEMESAYLYLSMATYFNSESFPGMAQWMRVQAQEELSHALRFLDHVEERSGRVELLALSKPQRDWASPLEAFEAAYEHEKFITAKIDDLMSLAREVKDNAAAVMLQWFVTEQVEEEATAQGVVDMLRRIGDSGHGLVMIDRELGGRGAASEGSEE